jgi:hypothetical protein
MMDNLFDSAASKVVHEYAADDMMVCIVLRKREGFEWGDVDVGSQDYRRQVVKALSCNGRIDVCADCDCALEWSRRMFAGVAFLSGPVALAARLRRCDGQSGRRFHVLGGSCTGKKGAQLMEPGVLVQLG